MPLKARGDSDSTNKDNSTGNGRKKIQDALGDAERRFGVAADDERLPQIDPETMTQEEMVAEMKSKTAPGTMDALMLMMRAIDVYNKLAEDEANQELLAEFYMYVDMLTECNTDVLRTVIASGIVSTATLKKMGQDND